MTTPMPHDDDTPRVVDLAGPDGLRLRLLDRGATWWSLQVPVRGESQPREVLLGAATPTIHVTNQAYLGATVGRVANRIGGASIERDGRRWPLQPQPGSRHQLHGGPDGYDRRRWTLLRATPDSACLGLQSPPLDQGFPGALSVEVEVWLRGGGVVEQQFRASCTEPTPVCLTNHAYFNLDGATTDVRAHRLQVDASHWVPVDDELQPPPPQPADRPVGAGIAAPRQAPLAGPAGSARRHAAAGVRPRLLPVCRQPADHRRAQPGVLPAPSSSPTTSPR
jgi:aldose 1-epimerase